MAYKISGDVKIGSTPLARTVRAYNRTTGVLAGSTVSDSGTGYFEIFVPGTGPYVVLAVDPTENAQVFDHVSPLTVSSAGVLDSFALNVSAAYSVRRLFTTYAGAALRVRNSGGTQLDIGFDLDGLLDAAALSTHLGSGDGTVVTWYDQSGGGHNLTQATAAAQPLIATAGTIHGALRFDGSDDLLLTAGNVPSAGEKSIYYSGKPFASAQGGTPVCWHLAGTNRMLMSYNGGNLSQPDNGVSVTLHNDNPQSEAARAFLVDASVTSNFPSQVTLRKGGSTYPNTLGGSLGAGGTPVGGGALSLGGMTSGVNFATPWFSSFVVYDELHSTTTADSINTALTF